MKHYNYIASLLARICYYFFHFILSFGSRSVCPSGAARVEDNPRRLFHEQFMAQIRFNSCKIKRIICQKQLLEGLAGSLG